VRVEGSQPWTWNGDLDAPTFSPSVLVTMPMATHTHRCHSFVEAGTVRFLDDCTHALAGRTVALAPFAADAPGVSHQ